MAGGAYPVGGASEIAFHIIPVVEAAGGRLLVRAEVSAYLGGRLKPLSRSVKAIIRKADRQTIQNQYQVILSTFWHISYV